MSKNRTTAQKSLSVADKLQRQLDRIQAAERKKFLNENIVRLQKNGDLSYESVRTHRVPVGQASGLPEIRQGDAPAEPHKPKAQATHEHKPEAQARGLGSREPHDADSANPPKPKQIRIHCQISCHKPPPRQKMAT